MRILNITTRVNSELTQNANRAPIHRSKKDRYPNVDTRLASRADPGRGARCGRLMLEAFGALAEKLDLRRAEPDEVLRSHGNRPVDTEDRDLEFVSRLDRIRQHDPIRYAEALDGGRAGIAAAARHVPVDPDFRVVVDIGRKHGFCVDRFEIADLRRYRQHRSVPDERHFTAATSSGEPRGVDRRP